MDRCRKMVRKASEFFLRGVDRNTKADSPIFLSPHDLDGGRADWPHSPEQVTGGISVVVRMIHAVNKNLGVSPINFLFVYFGH